MPLRGPRNTIARVIVVALGLLTAPGRARADDAAEARLHFELGTVEFRAGHYPAALEHFLAADRLAPTPNTVFDLAQAYAAMGRDAEAYRFFSDYVALPGASPANAAIARAAVARLEPTLARVQIDSDPPGATIYVDRVELGAYGATPRVLALAPGAHRVVVRRDGYHDGSAAVDAVRGALSVVALPLERRTGTLRLTSAPSDAIVWLDGAANPAGRTPLSLTLAPGLHRLRVRRDGWLDATRELEVREGTVAVLDERLAIDPATTAVLSVVSNPPGARVALAGRVLGLTPLALPITDVAGPREIAIERPGCTPLRRTLLLRPGRETRVAAMLGVPRAARSAWVPGSTVAGGVLVAAGLVLGGLAIGTHAGFAAQPSRALYDRTGALDVAADATTAAGLALLALGVAGFVFVPDPSRSTATVRDEADRAAGR